MPNVTVNTGNANAVHQTEENVAQDAVDETGFGKFNIKVMIICSLIFLNVAFSVTSIGFILPSAACDFKMTTADKGQLSAAPMIGMLCGSYVWGCYAAMKGRKSSLLFSLFLHGGSEFLASVMPFYWVFLSLKFVSGAAMNGQTAVVFMYLGEFQPTVHRDRMLSWMETAWVSGILVLAGVAWLIIPTNVEIDAWGFVFHSWNLFVLICAMLPLIIGAWLIWFPETPKYLAETGQNDRMIKVLMRMYAENTGNPPKEYITRLKNSGNSSLVGFVNRATHASDKQQTDERSLRTMVKQIIGDTILVVKPPYLIRTILICLISCLIMSSYYTLTLWLPELFHRYANFEMNFPNESATVCTLTRTINVTTNDEFGADNCGTVQQSVFVNTFILGVSCIPAGILLPVLIGFVGYKYLLVAATIIPGIVTVGLFLVSNSTQNLILTCIFESITSVSISIVYCLLVDLYPTNLRAMASGLAACLSRAGAIIGNLMIGFLIDEHCVALIIIIAAQLLASGIFAMFIPGRSKTKKKETPQENKPC